MLAHWAPDRPTRVEVDASGFATGGVISQKGEDDLWHPIACRSESMISQLEPSESTWKGSVRTSIGCDQGATLYRLVARVVRCHSDGVLDRQEDKPLPNKAHDSLSLYIHAVERRIFAQLSADTI